jgi:hypothetical protein
MCKLRMLLLAGRWVTYPFVFCLPLYFVRDSSKDSYVRSGTENGVNTPRIRGFLSRRRLGILYILLVLVSFKLGTVIIQVFAENVVDR